MWAYPYVVLIMYWHLHWNICTEQPVRNQIYQKIKNKVLLFDSFNELSLEFHDWARQFFLGNWIHELQHVFIFSHLYKRGRLWSYKFWCKKLNRFLTKIIEEKWITYFSLKMIKWVSLNKNSKHLFQSQTVFREFTSHMLNFVYPTLKLDNCLAYSVAYSFSRRC